MSCPPAHKPIVAVCGATGFQGGSVVKHLLRDGSFAVRALTRKPNSAHAKEIASLGAEVVWADFDDLASLCEAFRGCYGVFGVTDYYDAYEKEGQQGINIVDAAKTEGVEHVVLSSGDLMTGNPPVTKYKHEAANYLRQSGVPFTIFITSWYYGNIFLFDTLKRDVTTGGWHFQLAFPTDIPIPSMSPKDVGAYILAGFKNPSEWIGREMRIVNELITPREYAETFAEITGSPMKIQEVTYEDFLAMKNEHIVLESWRVFNWFIEMHHGVRPQFDIDLTLRLHPTRQTWQQFAKEHLEAPPEHPTMLIQCVETEEQFTERLLM